MSNLLARIMLALLMLPLACVVFFLSMYTWFEILLAGTFTPNQSPALVFATLVTWLFVMFYWTLLWRRTVHWTRARLLGTAGITVGAVLTGMGAGSFTARVDTDMGLFFGGVMTVLSWLTASVFVWRETKTERVQRVVARNPHAVVCPLCGYNLTGLRQTTCPECGRTYTLQELMALQPGREQESDLQTAAVE